MSERAGSKKERTFYDLYIKRCFDIIASFLGMIILSPVFLIVSIAVYMDDPGPVLFRQKRVGINKTLFSMHKFRSMKMSAPHDTPTHLLTDPDAYITRVGRFIRKFSLDELPQFWDIFTGKLSVIGPRCALWNQYDLIDERDKYGANDIRPGLTGWAQIHGRDELEIEDKAKLDGYYTEQIKKSNLSGFIMDVRCFFGSVKAVLSTKGVVEGGTGTKNQMSEGSER